MQSVFVDIEEAPHGNRGDGHVGILAGAVEAFDRGGAFFHVGDEFADGVFGFVEDEVVDFGEEGVFAGEEGPAADGGCAGGFAAFGDFVGGVSLDGHAGDEDVVGPGVVFVGEVADVEVDEAFFPLGGKQWRRR